MNPLVLSILLGATPSTPSTTTPEAPTTTPTEATTVTLRVTSVLGDQDDAQVREVVSARVADTLEGQGFSMGDDSPRLLLIRVGWSETAPTDYEVQISTAKNEEAAPRRVEVFECSCSAPELLDEIDRRLKNHLPTVFEDEPPQTTRTTPPPAPAPTITPPSPPRPDDKQAWPAHHDTPLFAGGVAAIALGGSVLVGIAIGLPIAIADDHTEVPTAAYAAPAIGVAGIITGAVLLVVNKKRHKAHLTSLAPLSGRF